MNECAHLHTTMSASHNGRASAPSCLGEENPHHDILVVIAEATTEDVHAPRVVRLICNTDAQPD
jgi:hypothetical protein